MSATASVPLVPAEMLHALTVAHAEIARLRLTEEEREVVERALSLAGQGERRPEKVAVIRRLLGRFRP